MIAQIDSVRPTRPTRPTRPPVLLKQPLIPSSTGCARRSR